MKIESWPIARPVPYPKNARKLSARAVDVVAASLREFGWRQAIVVDEHDVIVAGHTRLLAAQKLEMTTVPVHVATGLTPAQIQAYRLADNRTADESSWDLELLGEEMKDLVGQIDVALTGFDESETAKLLAELLVDEDEAPAAPEKPATGPGDVWLLGKHRLLCGDSTVAANVETLLAGAKPLLMVTDPPYGVEYDPAWRGRAKCNDGTRTSLGVHATGQVQNDSQSDWREAWALFPGDVAYVWCASLHSPEAAESLRACDFELRAQIIWAKNNIAISRGHYHWQHEPCWYAVKKGATGHWAGDRKQTTVWAIDKPMKSETGHGTQKPVECMRRPIVNNSLPGDAVYDPFCGSGSTLIACETEGRHCLAMELDPKYCDVIVARWEAFTGKKATREGAQASAPAKTKKARK